MKTIDIDQLLKEISPEAPSGDEDLEYDPEFIALEEDIKGSPEIEIGGKIVQEEKPPNWGQIQERAVNLLARSHDLRLAVSLTRALLHNNGFSGFCNGLRLISGFVEHYWETLYPLLDPDDNFDPEYRLNILLAICDRDTIINPLMNLPILRSPALGDISLRKIYIANGKLEVTDEEKVAIPDLSTIHASFEDSDPEALASLLDDLNLSIQNIELLEQLLIEKIGSLATPSFREIKEVLDDIFNFINPKVHVHESILSEPSNPEQIEPGEDGNNGLNQSTSFQGNGAMDRISNRHDIIRILDQICQYYQNNEPASPVPLLLKRAKKLVDKDFIEIIKDLTPGSIDQIKLISGLEDESS